MSSLNNRLLFEHIRYGTYFIHFSYPPRLNIDVDGFEDGLKDIIPQKIKRLLERSQDLKDKRSLDLRLIQAKTNIGSEDEFFWTTLAFHEYSEYYIIQKWLNYWLSLWYKATKQGLPKQIDTKLNQIDENDIVKAKQNPLENHFPEPLRRVGTRLVGLCPFHQEKSPSFNIYTETNTYFCFGCQASGDGISFIKQVQNLTFPEAVRYLI